jgi:hypothetical protein
MLRSYTKSKREHGSAGNGFAVACDLTFGEETMIEIQESVSFSHFILGAFAWIGIPILHAVWMMIDWRLRDPNSPSAGGISSAVTTVFQWGSLAAFGILVFLSFARIEIVALRILLAVLATALAFGVMMFGWLRYITRNCIDTL